MQQNQYGQTYSGNDDFRGWLSANGAGELSPYDLGITGQGPLNSQGTYNLLLNNVGNDGRSSDAMFDKAGQSLYSQWQSGRQPAAPVDPYAKWGGQSAYNSLVSGFNTQKSNIASTAGEAASQYASGLPLSINDMIHNLTRNQEAIDRKGVQNESSKIQGSRDIMDMVGRGIKSGGVMLANKNAGASSAAQAIANAYAQLGGKQMGKLNQQYATNADNISLDQKEQDYQLQLAPQQFHQKVMDTINNIVLEARNKFAELDAAMANASLPDRINIEAEKEAVRRDALSKLQGFDSQFASQASGIKAADRVSNISKANELLATGQADSNLFNYSTQAPAQFQGTGPYASELPLFTYRRRS